MRPLSTLIFAACLQMPLMAADDDSQRTFDVVGVVKKLKPEIRTAVIDHEEIPGYMAAMVMSLEVLEISDLDGIRPGDKIRFRLNVTEDDGWIDQLEVIEAAKSPPAVEKEPEALVAVKEGDIFPDADLVDERGKPFKISDHLGEAFAVTYIYTRCPFPNFCPRINSRFRAAQKLLLGDPEAPENWRLLSVSIEPGHDTPEVLREFAQAQGADPERWRFATGTLREITRLGLRSGLRFWDDRGVVQHNLRTFVVDPAGKVTKVFGEEDFTAEELAASLRAAADAVACECEEDAAAAEEER